MVKNDILPSDLVCHNIFICLHRHIYIKPLDFERLQLLLVFSYEDIEQNTHIAAGEKHTKPMS